MPQISEASVLKRKKRRYGMPDAPAAKGMKARTNPMNRPVTTAAPP